MVKKLVLVLWCVFLLSCQKKDTIDQTIISSDIENFWAAFDKIQATKDIALHLNIIQKEYIDIGSVGLKNIMQVKGYTAREFVDAINNYPQFWQSVRDNTTKSGLYIDKIIASIQKLRAIYPDLKHVPIYFTIGVLRTGGTILDSTVLIGSELSFADKSVKIDELPAWRQPFFKEYTPINEIDLLCTHEYVHTQQKELVHQLLIYCLYEGVAEFVSTTALGVESNVPAVHFGKKNEALVKAKFEQDIFNPLRTYNWLWGENMNELKIRDLGYYIGYQICENYYQRSNDKMRAIREMIELDFSNDSLAKAFVNKSGFLNHSINELKEMYENTRPTITSMTPFENNSLNVDPSIKQITLHFSVPMNIHRRGFDYGPLGEANALKVERIIGFSEDSLSITFEVDLLPDQQYQCMITDQFSSNNGVPLKPFLIDFTTQ